MAAELKDLLIEPVWNRNEPTSFAKASIISSLLIEPVWNRNPPAAQTAAVLHQSFNRTSLESKLLLVYASCEQIYELLIEPVWNRNVYRIQDDVIREGYF